MRKFYDHASAAFTALAILWAAQAQSADLPGRTHSCKCPKPKPETCEQQARRLEPISNTIETTVVMTFAEKACFLPDRLPRIVAPGEEVSIRVRHVFNNNLFVPVGGRELRLTIVDSFGYAYPHRVISVDRVRSTNTGFADREISFRAEDAGVYRIRVDYIDRDSPNFVMSPNIIVIGGGQ